MTYEIRVAYSSEIAPGTMRGYDVGDSRILVANIDGEFYAMDAICGHSMANLDEGDLNGRIVMCPLHTSEFDVTNGKYIDGPSGEDQKSYNVILKDGEIFVEM